MSLSWIDASAIAIRRPAVIGRRLQMVWNDREFRRRRLLWLSRLAAAPIEKVQTYVREVESDGQLLDAVRNKLYKHTSYWPMVTDFMLGDGGGSLFFHCVSLYAFVRLVRPQNIIETGGTPGKSSAFILRGLQRNCAGRLYTLDLPPKPFPADRMLQPSESFGYAPAGAGSGWLIPEFLRRGHTLITGDTRATLPMVLDESGEIDLFIHDSDHSYDHLSWELKTAHSYLRRNGFLWCDDIFTNNAWPDFCNEYGLRAQNFKSQGVAQIDLKAGRGSSAGRG
jgi:hypothetical protein